MVTLITAICWTVILCIICICFTIYRCIKLRCDAAMTMHAHMYAGQPEEIEEDY